MKLIYLVSHKSVAPNSPVHSLPKLIVLTGPNGTGKTHLLEALAEGKALIVPDDYEHDPERGISTYRSTTRLLRTSDLSGAPDSLRMNKFSPESFRQARADAREESMRYHESRSLRQVLLDYLSSYGVHEATVEKVEVEHARSVELLDGDEFLPHIPISGSPPFPFYLRALDEVRRYEEARLADVQERALDAELTEPSPLPLRTFEEQNGPPPWHKMNDALKAAGFAFTIAPPRVSRTVDGEGRPSGVAVEVEFVRTANPGVRIRTEDMSAGELVLLRIILANPAGEAGNPVTHWPKVLLLDEPDAHMHPSIVRALLTTIQDVFIDRLGLTVVISTHSPTTVALAPDSSLMLTHLGGRIEPVAKEAAIRALLVGVPTVTVEPSNQRLVLVEDVADERIHSLASTLLRDQLAGERSLTFLGLSARNGKEGGKARVKQLVKDLRGNTHSRVWGLVDGDGASRPEPPVFAAQGRHSIENFALDPLTLGLYLIQRDEPGFPPSPPEGEEGWQVLADLVTARAFDLDERGDRQAVTYGVGQFMIARAHLSMNGHELERHLRERFAILTKLYHANRTAGAMSNSIARAVWMRHPGVIDRGLVDVYQAILNAPT